MSRDVPAKESSGKNLAAIGNGEEGFLCRACPVRVHIFFYPGPIRCLCYLRWRTCPPGIVARKPDTHGVGPEAGIHMVFYGHKTRLWRKGELTWNSNWNPRT